MTKTQWRALGVLGALMISFGIGTYFGVYQRGHDVAVAADAPSSISGGVTTIVLNGTSQPKDVDMTQFWAAYSLLNQNFVVTHASSTFPTKEKQLYGAIAGLTSSFGDPYTTFFPPSDAQVFQEDISGSFGGVGMQIDNNAKGQLVVVSPLKDTPSARAGIRSGDLILQIGTSSTNSLAVEEAVKLIRGPKGTTVTFTLSRQGEPKPLIIPVVRDTINIPIINNYKRDDGIYVIELYSFSQNSPDLFRGALRDFMQSGSNRLILDLRGNPGGYLEAAVNMASYFLPTGDLIVTEDFKGKQQNTTHRSVGYNVFANKGLKMAILVDQGSASASEILAGALSQHSVGKLVGTRTFGKGSVQELMDLGGGAQLKITIARWLTPNGSSISDGGLQPDIPAARTSDDFKAGKDPQTEAAVSYLLNN